MSNQEQKVELTLQQIDLILQIINIAPIKRRTGRNNSHPKTNLNTDVKTEPTGTIKST